MKRSNSTPHYKRGLTKHVIGYAYIFIYFSHISQRPLKPGEEEIKKKGWWQFWRRS
jgi:hypothetical protein